MIRRILLFLIFVAVVGSVSALVYLNAGEQSFRLSPKHELTLPLGVLMLMAAVAGMLFMFVLALLREGRSAIREWRVHRNIRSAERTAELRAEARSLSLAGDYERARALFTRATKQRTQDVGDLIDFAGTYVLEGDYAKAIRVLENGQKDFGNDPLLLYALARACQRAGDDAAAASALERALAVYPKSRRLLTTLRDVLIETDQWSRAAEIQQRIVELMPEDAVEKNWLLGIRYEAAERLEGAERGAALKALCAQAPEFVPAVRQRARDLAARGEEKRAAKLLDKTVRTKAHGVLLDELEALTKDEPGRLAKLYSKLLSNEPENEKLRRRAAAYFIESDLAEEAADLLKNTGAESDVDAEERPYALWAAIYEARSFTAEAQAAYKNAVLSGEAAAPLYDCELCGASAPHWDARCDRCGAWGTLDDV